MIASGQEEKRLEIVRVMLDGVSRYRVVSGSTALVGGLLSLGGFATAYYAKHRGHANLTPRQFVIVWVVVLALTVLSSLLFLWRGAARTREPLFSARARLAMLSVAPSFFIAALLTCLLHRPIQLGILWMVLYGLGLLATQSFAPRALLVLGGAFLVSGAALMIGWKHIFVSVGHAEPSPLVVSGIMAATFGGYHLAYAAAVWALRGEPEKK